MIKVETLTLGQYQTNTYLVYEATSKTCAIIDPGYEAQTILQAVASLGLTVDAILLTHGHFDHVGAVEEIVAETGCRLWMREGDWSLFPNPVNTYFYPLASRDFTEILFCEDLEEISAGGLTFLTLETPGHTRGSVCYLCGNVLFSGDTLFAGSCGRTDLPGGDSQALKDSLVRLRELTEDFRVCPGHGPATTLSREKLSNPCLL